MWDGAGSDPGHDTGFWESNVKVNCVDEVGFVLVDACCCNRLIFSCPRGTGSFSAVAIAFEIIPEFSSA